MNRWLKRKEACKYAQLSDYTFRRCVKAGLIKGNKRKIGGWIYDRLSIDEYNSGDNGRVDALYDDFAKRADIC